MALELTDRQKVGHLLRRFGFGAGLPDMAEYEGLGPKKAMEKLLDFGDEGGDIGEPMQFAFKTEGEAEPGGYRFRLWWMMQMVASKTPLREKLALFWHDHFACNEENVSHGLSMLDYMQKLRSRPHAPFRDILEKMTKSTAVMRELNVEMFSKAQPNENFARELLELYTLGEGHYTEKDIHEIARAMTGWAYMDVYWRLGANNDERLTAMRRFDTPALFYFYAPEAHIGGAKSVLGQQVDGFDEVLSLLAKHPQTAKYISTKLWEWFAYPNPEATVVERLAGRFLNSGGSIKDVLREITEIPEFWSEKCFRKQIKNPVDYAVSICRAQNAGATIREKYTIGKFNEPAAQHIIDNMGALAYRFDLTGMNLFFPPSVAGWDWGTAWISTNTMLRRREFTGIYTYYPEEKDGKTEWLPDKSTLYVVEQVKARNPQDVDALTNAFLTVYDCPLSEDQHAVLRKHFEQSGGPDAWKNDRHMAWRYTLALQLLGSSPDFQMC